MMKKLIFIFLKIAEVSLLPIAYVLFGYIGWFLIALVRYYKYDESFVLNPHDFGFLQAFFGFLMSGLVFSFWHLILIVIEFVPDLFDEWINSNKRWSQNIVNWLKRVKRQ